MIPEHYISRYSTMTAENRLLVVRSFARTLRADETRESARTKQQYKGVGVIYHWINNLNGRTYVGHTNNRRLENYFVRVVLDESQTTRTASRDARLTSSYLERTKGMMPICGALHKYGFESFSLNILEIVKDTSTDNLLQREYYWFRLIQPSYNLADILNPFAR